MKQKIFLIPLLLSLISASSSNFIYVKSNIRHEDIYCKKQLQNYHSKTITTLSNIKKLPVAKLTFNYELYQMYNQQKFKSIIIQDLFFFTRRTSMSIMLSNTKVVLETGLTENMLVF